MTTSTTQSVRPMPQGDHERLAEKHQRLMRRTRAYFAARKRLFAARDDYYGELVDQQRVYWPVLA